MSYICCPGFISYDLYRIFKGRNDAYPNAVTRTLQAATCTALAPSEALHSPSCFFCSLISFMLQASQCSASLLTHLHPPWHHTISRDACRLPPLLSLHVLQFDHYLRTTVKCSLNTLRLSCLCCTHCPSTPHTTPIHWPGRF